MYYRSILLHLLLLCNILLVSVVDASPNQLWTDITSTNTSSTTSDSKELRSSLSLLPDQYRLFRFDEGSMRSRLNKRFNVATKKSKKSITSQQLTIPLPNGKVLTLNLVASQVMAPALAAKYPQIKTYQVVSTDNKGVYGSVDITEQGFHAMLFMQDGTRLFIDPRRSGGDTVYISYYDKDYRPATKKPFRCENSSHNHSYNSSLTTVAHKAANRAGTQLKTYRLAMASTGEYTAFHGGKEAALSAIVTTISRVNEIYQRDLAIKLQLVENTDALIQLNTTTYSNNNDDAMLSENQVEIDRVIGSANYDVGHVVSTGGGGLATLGATCNSDVKAEGVTGSSQPVGDAFDIDFVAHEIGHQFGGTHTFNSVTENCGGANREGSTAYEPGSGSTIMSYAGICGARNNTQANSDAMFHITSIVQISDYIETGEGSACGVSSPLDNQQPSADAGNDFIIPANTPFELIGKGSDPDKDSLTYSWEQVDVGAASDISEVGINNAIFRTFLPKFVPSRVFPALSKLLSNTTSKGETLPTLARELNFSFVVRDGKGGIAADEMKVTVNSSEPFRITSHNLAVTLKGGTTTSVVWDVASTNLAPINCISVDIQLSTNGGSSFSTLLSNTANDGSAAVSIPVNVQESRSGRFKVKCANNIFFDISDIDLTVESLIDALPPVLANIGSNKTVDPGETILLIIPLQNNSSTSATSVTGTLTSVNTGVEIKLAHSLYPTIPALSQANNTIAYEVDIPDSYTCGDDIPITLNTNFTLGSPTTKPFDFSVPTGVATLNSETNTTAIELPDNNPIGVTSQLTVKGVGQIVKPNINIDIDINHAYRGDVVISLTSPQGTTVLLKELFPTDDGLHIKGNFPKTLSSTASLNAFDGENLDGIWRLKVSDDNGGDTGTLNSWTLNYTNFICDPPDIAPIANDSSILVSEGLPSTGKLLASDTNGNSLLFTIVGNGSKGIATLTNTSTGEFIYTPNDGEKAGEDSFTFKVNDGTRDSNIATVTATIQVAVAPNVAPIALNDVVEVDVGEALTIDVLGNDSDADSDNLTIVASSNLKNGAVTLVNNKILYTPNLGFFGVDSFSYTISDGNGHQVTAVVTVTVKALSPPDPPVSSPVNSQPVALNGTLVVKEGESKSGRLNAKDAENNILTYRLVSNGAKGKVELTNAATGVYIYIPETGETGQDSFTFRVNDGINDSNLATVSITITSSLGLANNLVTNNTDSTASVVSRGGGGSLGWYFFPVLLLLKLLLSLLRAAKQQDFISR